MKDKIKIRDRIRELRRARAGDLLPHPKNWRKHSPEQAAALSGILKQIGYADAVLVRELKDGELQILDGHLRASLDPEEIVPVLVLDVNEREAEMVLLTLDPLAAMAESDMVKAAELAADLEAVDPALQAMIDAMLPEDKTPVEMKQLSLQAPPKMTWVLVGIPTVRFGEINQLVERMATVEGIILETTVNDGGNHKDGQS